MNLSDFERLYDQAYFELMNGREEDPVARAATFETGLALINVIVQAYFNDGAQLAQEHREAIERGQRIAWQVAEEECDECHKAMAKAQADLAQVQIDADDDIDALRRDIYQLEKQLEDKANCERDDVEAGR